MAVGSRDTPVTERWRDVRRWQPCGVWSWRRNHPEFTHWRGDSIHQRKRCVLDGLVDTTRSNICQSRVGFSAAGQTLNGFCGGQLSHQHSVSPVRPLENVEDGSSDGGGREDSEDDDNDEDVPEVIPVTRETPPLAVNS